jgi:hypothetical protein
MLSRLLHRKQGQARSRSQAMLLMICAENMLEERQMRQELKRLRRQSMQRETFLACSHVRGQSVMRIRCRIIKTEEVIKNVI